MIARAPLLALAALLALAPGAGAATITTDAFLSFENLHYEASPLEANRLKVTEQPPLTIVEDPGAVRILVTGRASGLNGGPCTAVTPHRVVCRKLFTNVGATLGDREDTATLVGPFDGSLSGGLARDRLVGGGGADLLNGGAGTDDLSGGAGVDLVSWFDTTQPTRVTLDGQANDGVAGENDFVRGDIEGVLGSQADDVLVGNAQTNQLWSSGGDDTIDGGAGDDSIDSGAGADVMIGGAGTDYLYNAGSGRDDIRARDGETDHITCGTFELDLLDVDPFDTLTGSCGR
jgi:Ca2+-binding RTX toxin-like protein